MLQRHISCTLLSINQSVNQSINQNFHSEVHFGQAARDAPAISNRAKLKRNGSLAVAAHVFQQNQMSFKQPDLSHTQMPAALTWRLNFRLNVHFFTQH